jgi:hypothetical protein
MMQKKYFFSLLQLAWEKGFDVAFVFVALYIFCPTLLSLGMVGYLKIKKGRKG